MKRNRLTIGIISAILVSTGMRAQTLYEANRLTGADLNGTARFVGMGGAMGALGGDISTMGTNPAGIGIYRSNDVMVSFGFNNTGTKSNFSGTTLTAGRFRGSFDNAGFVYTNKIGNKTALKYVNFGFNYHKSKNFNKSLAMAGNLAGASQTWQMAFMTEGLTMNQVDGLRDGSVRDPYDNPDYGWLTIMGAKSNLIYNRPVMGPDGRQETDKEGNPLYYDALYDGAYGKYANYQGKESGGVNQYDFNVSFNLEDQFYLGFTLGAYDVNYSKNTFYTEEVDGGTYGMDNWFRTDGAGIDFKIGAIIRPVASSSFRFGLAVHTPTWYNLTDTHSAYFSSDAFNTRYSVDTYGEAGDVVRDYQLVTPWKFNLSLGYVIGTSVALGAEYEYADHSTAKLKDVNGVSIRDENERIKSFMKAVHTVRLGVEAKLMPQFSVRAGYNFSTAALKKDAYKQLPAVSTRTDTDFENTESMNHITLGLGYRGNLIYADLAYQYGLYKSDFYAFDQLELPATKVDNDRHQLLLTVGLRF